MNRTRSVVVVVLIALSGLVVGLASSSSASPGKQVHGFHQFESPSRNIGCEIAKNFTRCDIQKHSFHSPPTPKRCHGGYGDALSVAAHGKADFVCHTDTALDGRAPKLKYGHSLSDGQMRCTSRLSGLTCKSLTTGHGFFLSKQSYRRF